MSVFTENKIYELYEANRRAAADKLKQIPVYCGNAIGVTYLFLTGVVRGEFEHASLQTHEM